MEINKMQFTVDKRGNFKTTNLIKRCNAENQKSNNLTYIVCPNRERVRAVADLAERLGIDIPFPITMDELLHSHRWHGSYIKNVLIDDIDLWLRQQTPFNILEVTASIDED